MNLRELFEHPALPPISLRDIAAHLLHHERQIMSALDDLNAKADALAAQTAANHTAIQELIALATSKGATDAEIAAITAKLDGSLQALASDDAAATAAVTPPAAPAPADPAPAPADPAPDAPAP